MAQHQMPDGDRDAESSLENEPAYSEGGVDLTLIRWILSLTPAERLEVLQQSVESLMSLRDARASR